MENGYFLGINHLITRFKKLTALPVAQEEEHAIPALLYETEDQLCLLEESFRDGCLLIDDLQKLNLWCRTVQTIVILFSDTLYSWQKKLPAQYCGEEKYAWAEKAGSFLSTLQSFLHYLKQEFPDHFDASHCISWYEQDGFQCSITIRLKLLRKKWRSSCAADESLQKLAFSAFEIVPGHGIVKRYNGHFLSFLTCLLSGMETLVFTGSSEKDTALLIHCLIAANFNDPAFIRYDREQILKMAIVMEDKATQLDFLWTQQKLLHQIVPDRNSGYYQRAESVSDQLDCFLEEEIGYLKRTIPALPQAITETRKPAMLHFTIPVESIAILLRMMVETGIIKTSNLTQMFNTVLPALRSKNKEDITLKSFHSKYYTTDLRHINAVKDLLYEMIRGLRGLQ